MKENELNALKENGSQLHDEILHEHQIKSSVKMQSQDIQINLVQAMDDSLIMQRQKEKVNMREAVDTGLVVTESSRTKPDKHDTSSSSGNYTTQAVDADIRPVNNDEPFAEVQLTALHICWKLLLIAIPLLLQQICVIGEERLTRMLCLMLSFSK
ncbi:hypothetical protein Tco_0433011 [Tanacetum coccineum]